jgi:hypothetical protein
MKMGTKGRVKVDVVAIDSLQRIAPGPSLYSQGRLAIQDV